MVGTAHSGYSYNPHPNPDKSHARVEGGAKTMAAELAMTCLIIAQGVFGGTVAVAFWTYPSEVLNTRQRTTAMGLGTLVYKACRTYLWT